MNKNIEIKAFVPNRDKLIENIEQNTTAEWTAIIDQHDTFYNAPNARLKLRRIARHCMYELISYSRADTLGPKTSTVNRTSIDNKDLAEKLHENLTQSLGVKIDLKKSRLLYMLGKTRIHVDTVEGLGEFVEFEVSINECDLIEDGEKTANELMHKLGIQEKDLLTGAYADHLMSKLASLFESGVENMFSVQFSDITNQLLAKKLEIGFTVKPVYFNSIVFIFKENVDFHSLNKLVEAFVGSTNYGKTRFVEMVEGLTFHSKTVVLEFGFHKELCVQDWFEVVDGFECLGIIELALIKLGNQHDVEVSWKKD